MRILVTGGAGFIGKHLVNYLLKKGNKVTIFDNFSNSNKKSIEILQNEDVKIIEGDIREIEDILNAAKDQNIIIHLAAKISVEESIMNPFETFNVNVDGTKNVLEACKKNKISKLIVASSAAVYGDSLSDIKLTENAKINPVSPYGESKARMEKEIIKFLTKNENIDCIILRFFNIFGIGQTSEYAGVITKFLERIKQNQALQVFGDGTQTRDFVSVNDVVSSIYDAIIFGKSGTYNIASGKTITINELAKLMISWSRKNLEIQYLPQKKGDIKFSQAGIGLAKKEIKYSPKFGLEEIKKFL
ncbi:NDP-sugar dehydratase or epimerase [Nitrosopumilus zosterae]|uniref:NDP-sugar dehydratase or epimerase n=1 Tax=Nitrosopumilus zosterae TaxID=718286 RepID=A0A2S2KU06_9ARCH|nr:NAD-dependent epimerase/dehydratase family protein [Nitrosopumilus zosterae]BDQ31800.1 SDR family NAD(P)-dependent oxidoreductase [Nitrosopumilus zosterae]GBH35150.1 NDP-sugar dehydratase or epimerase [Nitrosopumilus zosterae]